MWPQNGKVRPEIIKTNNPPLSFGILYFSVMTLLIRECAVTWCSTLLTETDDGLTPTKVASIITQHTKKWPWNRSDTSFGWKSAHSNKLCKGIGWCLYYGDSWHDRTLTVTIELCKYEVLRSHSSFLCYWLHWKLQRKKLPRIHQAERVEGQFYLPHCEEPGRAKLMFQ